MAGNQQQREAGEGGGDFSHGCVLIANDTEKGARREANV
jgi:hypothetical protein